jgi:hypothetical protein
MTSNISKLLSDFDKIILHENQSTHIDHVEDLVFLEGSNGAKKALECIVNTAKNPENISIKFDGYPALIFGNDANNRFSIMDKHMFNKSDGSGRSIYSPQDFVNYDTKRGVRRDSLYKSINNIWGGLQKSCYGDSGYYWGDLLFSDVLQPSNNTYMFKPNPNGITYKVKSNSNMGSLLANKVGGIAVHQYLNNNATSLNEAVEIQNGIGNLKNNSNILIIPTKLPVSTSISLDSKDVEHVSNEIEKCSGLIDQLMNSTSDKNIYTRYINNKIRSGNLQDLYNDFYDEKYNTKVNDYMRNNSLNVKALLTIWVLLYRLKMKVLNQLNKAYSNQDIVGYLDDGSISQEGFVSNKMKFVDRMGFSRQNFKNNS